MNPPDPSPRDHEVGERRHETCRHGLLTPAYRVDHDGEAQTVIPICGWMPEPPVPPPVHRAWGGNAVDFGRDCAFCKAHREVWR